MDIKKEVTEELKIQEDINHSLVLYNLDDLLVEDEINEGVGIISELSKCYRHVHVELKGKMSEEDYDEKYPDYDENLKTLTNFLKGARTKLRTIKTAQIDEHKHEEIQTSTLRTLNTLKIEEEFLEIKISQVEKTLDLANVEEIREVEAVEDYISKFEGFIKEYFILYGKFKLTLAEGRYEEMYAPRFNEKTETLRKKVSVAKTIKENILTRELKKKQASEKSTEISEHITRAENLYSEIDFRCAWLSKKFGIQMAKLSDYQILELSKDKNLDTELNGILDKVTQLASLVSGGGKDVQNLLDKANKAKLSTIKLQDKFSEKLQETILERDISESKIKNASNLKIDLPRFSGYDSKLDLYTFQTKFQKLIEPTIQKKYWAEYLKRNFLSEPALTFVQSEENYSNIWEKLKASFGDARLMLQNKLSGLDQIGGIWRVKGDENIATSIAALINSMNELSALALEHDIEGQLYDGGGLEKVRLLIGVRRQKEFVIENLDSKLSKKKEWEKLLMFLKKELLWREKLTLDAKTANVMGFSSDKKSFTKNPEKRGTRLDGFTAKNTLNNPLSCHICGKSNHTVVTTGKGTKIIPYYVCEEFVKMSPDERLHKLNSKTLCVGCMFPGATKGPKHKCFYTNFCCSHSSHGHDKLHVLLCEAHKNDSANVTLLNKFKDKFINNSKIGLPQFAKKLSCCADMAGVSQVMKNKLQIQSESLSSYSDVSEHGIFQLQTMEIEGVRFNVFYDSGCGDMVIKKSLVEKLERIGRAKQVLSGPLTISGVGDQKTICHDGLYSIRLPLVDGGTGIISGLCLPKVTTEFPLYPLQVVEKDIRKECSRVGGPRLVEQLPSLPRMVGGETDILLGIKYAKYFPKLIYAFESGLAIFESVFISPDGTRGVVSGPHSEFSKVEKSENGLHVTKYSCFQAPVQVYREMQAFGNDVPLLGLKTLIYEGMNSDVCEQDCDVYANKHPPRCVKRFDEIEAAGTVISYRCVDCRDCSNCKKGAKFESISIQEEIEQHLIEQSVSVDVTQGMTTAKLPFVTEPDTRLVPNEFEALKVYRAQIKKLSAKPEDKNDVIESESKLQNLGFVDYVSNLNADERAMIEGSDVKYFIPWRAVWNLKSVSTRCRLVFDASQSTRDGCSLNSLLAKGVNGMNKLIEILIKWTVHLFAFHTDIQKMYNAVRLDKAHWRYQLYLWDNHLDDNNTPQWKVIKTLIYGIRSSGNLAECGLRRLAELCKNEFPKAHDVIMNHMYVDDCLSGGSTWDEVLSLTDGLKMVLEKGGFTLKGFTFSGYDPPEHLSDGDDSVVVGGLRWFPKGDFFKLNIGELNFSRKIRGRKLGKQGVSLKNITKRDCVSRVAEVFDPLGRLAPVLGGMKLDISELHRCNLGWDDPIPNELKEIWLDNFNLIEEMGDIRFHRALVPEDAANLDIETIEMADAGEDLLCAAVYARFKRRNGEYSCQLVFARTKVIHDTTPPRAELEAALLNAITGFVVQKSFGDMHKKYWKVTDSQVALHWLNCLKSTLKMWVRSRVIEVTRLSDRSSWYHTRRKNMIADLGTRKGATLSQVGPQSFWNQGLPWMRGSSGKFPIENYHEIKLSSTEKENACKERVTVELENGSFSLASRHVPKEVGERYQFSKYLINPNKYRFRTVIRILSLAFLFIKNLNKKCNKNRTLIFLENCDSNETSDVAFGNKGKYVVYSSNSNPKSLSGMVTVVHLEEDVLNAARSYFFRKAACEIKEFVKPCKYEKKSAWKNGILYFTGRILHLQEIDTGLASTMLDLSASTFCVPMTDSRSPIAYAIVSETHWYDPDVHHKGVESVLRFSQQTAHIIGGRDLVKTINGECAKCRILHKKGVEAAMGNVGENNLKVAPAFYYSQVDICGPFSAYSPVNKRATLKIYFVVFCCTVTGAVDCRVMEDYTTDAFILAFIRFACRFGYPQKLMPDEASQLVKGCKDMIISFSDIQHKLYVEHGVEFKTCPVGAHYVHGKVERKIQEIKRSLVLNTNKHRLSVLQWETLGQQIANSANNMPIGLKNRVEALESLDILTPNRLLLGRNNNRNPTAPLVISNDQRQIIERNEAIFNAWFKEWLISYVPELVEKPKWFVTNRNISVGDIVLFLKSEQAFDRQYQYGIVRTTFVGRDGVVRSVGVEYQNSNENIKRETRRGVRELVVIHPVEEISITKELDEFANSAE